LKIESRSQKEFATRFLPKISQKLKIILPILTLLLLDRQNISKRLSEIPLPWNVEPGFGMILIKLTTTCTLHVKQIFA
jgi:hypothetical protein